MEGRWAAVAGLVGGMVALGVAELAAGALPRVPSLVVAVGDAIIDLAPRTVVEFGIGTFGRDDKTVLVVGILVVALALA
ncbi:MAG: molybdopterin-dependent oxidoreductase, partial [Acidimicrobiales bacterium]